MAAAGGLAAKAQRHVEADAEERAATGSEAMKPTPTLKWFSSERYWFVRAPAGYELVKLMPDWVSGARGGTVKCFVVRKPLKEAKP